MLFRSFTVTLGNGSAHVELESFGGTIALRRPGDPRPETERKRREKDKDKEKGNLGARLIDPVDHVGIAAKVARAMADVQPEIDRALAEAQPEIERAVAEAMREAQPEIDAAVAEAMAELGRVMPYVVATPRVNVNPQPNPRIR